MKISPFYTAMAGSILIAVFGAGLMIAEEEKPGPLAAQQPAAQAATCIRILNWKWAIVAFQKDHPRQELPRSLRALADSQGGCPPGAFEDGWGRPLIYFVTNDGHYMIASFGSNGVPEGQAVAPGGATPEGDSDADIVLIDGAWAQTPAGIGGFG